MRCVLKSVCVCCVRKALVRLFNKIEKGTMKEGRNLANRIIEIHKRRYVMSTFYESINIFIFGLLINWLALVSLGDCFA